MDLVLRNCRLRTAAELMDVGISSGKILSVERKVRETGSRELDLGSRLVTPAFVNPHAHLDKCLTGERVRSLESTLTGSLDLIALASSVKSKFTHDDIVARAGKCIETAVTYGTLFMRTFADVDTIGGLTAVKALLDVKKKYSGVMHLQVGAFPQEGIIRDPGTEELLYKAMELGADFVGGIPWYEYTEPEARKHTDIIFEIAKKYDKDIHMLVDDNEDPTSRNLEYLALKSTREGFVGRVTASHCRGALESPNDTYARKVVQLARKAEISIVDNPHVCLMLYGRQDKYPIRRAITRVKEFLAAGVNVTTGQDDVDDPYYPFGRVDMLELGFFMCHSGQFSLPSEIDTVFDFITVNAAKALGIVNYGLNSGCDANLVVLNAGSVHEAFRMQAERLYVLKSGRLVAETEITRRLIS